MQVEPFHSATQAKLVKTISPATCIMCEFAMKELDKLLITNSTEVILNFVYIPINFTAWMIAVNRSR